MTQLVSFDNYLNPLTITPSDNVIISTSSTSVGLAVTPFGGLTNIATKDVIVTKNLDTYTIVAGNKVNPLLEFGSNYIFNNTSYAGSPTHTNIVAYGFNAAGTLNSSNDGGTIFGYQVASQVVAPYRDTYVALGSSACYEAPIQNSVIVGCNSKYSYVDLEVDVVTCGYSAEMYSNGRYNVSVGSYAGQMGVYQTVSLGAYTTDAQAEILYNTCAIGSHSCRINTGFNGGYAVNIGYRTGLYFQQSRTVSIGSNAGSGVNNSLRMEAGSITIGHNCATNTSVPASSIAFGTDCPPPTAEGRIAFGNHMEVLSQTAYSGTNGSTPAQVAGYITIDYNGGTYKMPIYNM